MHGTTTRSAPRPSAGAETPVAANGPPEAVPHVRVGGIRTACLGEAELLALLRSDVERRRTGERRRPRTCYDVNGQALSMGARDPAYAAALENADIVHADGTFIVWASRLKRGGRVPERTATTDLLPAAAELAAREGMSFYLLGASEEINAACAAELVARYPGLRIAGRRDGYFTEAEEPAVIADINAARPDVVWVGLGKPREQAFAERVRDRLDCAWIATCGGCFHFIVGDYARAPAWMQRSGLEWLHRMATGPRYLVGRYLFTIPHAVGLVLGRDLLAPLVPWRR